MTRSPRTSPSRRPRPRPHRRSPSPTRGRRGHRRAAAPIMARKGLVGTGFVVTGFLGRTAYMNVDQVRQVESIGMVIGCHTVNHLDLSRVPLAVAKLQIEVSHQELETLIGKKVLDFAYPYGGYTTAVEQLVLANGFPDAVSTRGRTRPPPPHPRPPPPPPPHRPPGPR